MFPVIAHTLLRLALMSVSTRKFSSHAFNFSDNNIIVSSFSESRATAMFFFPFVYVYVYVSVNKLKNIKPMNVYYCLYQL